MSLPAGSVVRHRAWQWPLPWLVSVSAHAALLGVLAGPVPALPERPAMPEALTVLALPGDVRHLADGAPSSLQGPPRPRRGAPNRTALATGLRVAGPAPVDRPGRAVPLQAGVPAPAGSAQPPLAIVASVAPVLAPAGPAGMAAAAPAEDQSQPMAPAILSPPAPSAEGLAEGARPPAPGPVPAAVRDLPAGSSGPGSGAEPGTLVPAGFIDAPAPAYPESARRTGVQGVVELRARVRTDGRADSLRLLHSSGSPDLDAAALAGVARWRFRPAQRGAQAVAAWLDIPVRFVLTERDSDVR